MGSKGMQPTQQSTSSTQSGQNQVSYGTSTTTPNAPAGDYYRQILGTASNIGAIPYTPYEGQQVAGFTPDQLAAFQGVRQMQGMTDPYFQTAAGAYRQVLGAADPNNFARTVGQYYNPYQQRVVDATQRQFNLSNAQQQNELTGNALAKGAFGGSRVGIARAALAGQQQALQAPVIAGLQQQGYQQAANQYNTAAQQAALAGQGFGALGPQAQQAQLTGINALLGTGAQQQALGQQQLANAYQQWLMAQAYPQSQLGWQAGVVGGIGPGLGGTSTSYGLGNQQGGQYGTQTVYQAQPSIFSQLLGLGVAGLGAFGRMADGGAVDYPEIPDATDGEPPPGALLRAIGGDIPEFVEHQPEQAGGLFGAGMSLAERSGTRAQAFDPTIDIPWRPEQLGLGAAAGAADGGSVEQDKKPPFMSWWGKDVYGQSPLFQQSNIPKASVNVEEAKLPSMGQLDLSPPDMPRAEQQKGILGDLASAISGMGKDEKAGLGKIYTGISSHGGLGLDTEHSANGGRIGMADGGFFDSLTQGLDALGLHPAMQSEYPGYKWDGFQGWVRDPEYRTAAPDVPLPPTRPTSFGSAPAARSVPTPVRRPADIGAERALPAPSSRPAGLGAAAPTEPVHGGALPPIDIAAPREPASPSAAYRAATIADPYIKMLGAAMARGQSPMRAIAGILGPELGALGGSAGIAEGLLPKVMRAGLPRSAEAIGAYARPRSAQAIADTVAAERAAERISPAASGLAHIGRDIPNMASSTFRQAEQPYLEEMARRATTARHLGLGAMTPTRAAIARRFPSLPDFTEADFLAAAHADGGRVGMADGGTYAQWLANAGLGAAQPRQAAAPMRMAPTPQGMLPPPGVAPTTSSPPTPAAATFTPRPYMPSTVETVQPKMPDWWQTVGPYLGMGGNAASMAWYNAMAAYGAQKEAADKAMAQRQAALTAPRRVAGLAPTRLDYSQMDFGTGLYTPQTTPYYMPPYASGGAVRKGLLLGGVGDSAKDMSDEDLVTGSTDEAKRAAQPGLDAILPRDNVVPFKKPADDRFQSLLPQTLKFEGGISNDTGGLTNRGISSKAHPGLDVRSLTPAQTADIYRKEYYEGSGADKIENPALARIHYDTSVLAGPGRAKQILAASGGDPEKYVQQRTAFLHGLAERNPEKYGQYVRGWDNRTRQLAESAGLGGFKSPALAYSGTEGRPTNEPLGAIVGATAHDPAKGAEMVQQGQEAKKQGWMSEEMSDALIAAGLAMMAGTSPNAMTNIGMGGLAGFKAYQLAKKAPHERQLKDLELRKEIAQTQEAEYKAAHPTETSRIGIIGKDDEGNPVYGYTAGPHIGEQYTVPATPGTSGAPIAETEGLTGDAFLATRSASERQLIKDIAEGVQPLPPGTSQRALAIRKAVSQYAPDFDFSNAQARLQTRKQYGSQIGNAPGAMIRAGQTSMAHLKDVSDAAEELQNFDMASMNKIRQAWMQEAPNSAWIPESIKKKFGVTPEAAKALTRYQNALKTYSDEATKFYRGVGGTEADIQARIALLDPSRSVDLLREGIKENASLLHGQFQSLQDRWHDVMGLNAQDYPIIKPETKHNFKTIYERSGSRSPLEPLPESKEEEPARVKEAAKEEKLTKETAPVRRQFRNKKTNQMEWFTLKDGQWSKE